MERLYKIGLIGLFLVCGNILQAQRGFTSKGIISFGDKSYGAKNGWVVETAPRFEDTFAQDISYQIAPGAPELVTNGGFDSTTNGWTPTRSSIASIAGGQSGNCLELTYISGTTQITYNTSFATTIGAHYRISCYIKSGTSGNEDGRLYLFDSSYNALSFVSVTTSSDWRSITVDCVATTATSYVQLVKYSTTPGTMLFDTVSCKLLTGVNNTLSTGRGTHQVRTVVDTVGKMNTSGGKLYLTGGAAWGTGLIRYPVTRTSGLVGLYTFTTGGNSLCHVGIASNPSSPDNSMLISGNTLMFRPANSFTIYPTVFSANSTFVSSDILRTTGSFCLVKLNGMWTMLYPHYLNNTAQLYATMSEYQATSTNTLNSIRIPTQRWSPSPVASDSFTRADGALGSTDGLGHPEQNGGAGLAWNGGSGWSISSSKAINNPPTTNLSDTITTVQSSTANIIIEGKFTSTSSATLNCGYILNADSYSNPQNCTLVWLRTNNVVIKKIVGGTVSQLYNLPTGFTYSAGAKLMVVSDSVAGEIRIFYNNALITSRTDTQDAGIKNNKIFGIFADNTDQSIDDVVVWSRGTEGQYKILDVLR